MSNTSLKIGCVADDFTGASDAASFLRSHGLKTILYSGIPKEKKLQEPCDAVVIALKSRTAPIDEAIENSLHALIWLRNSNAQQLYIKYCSTFDSTKQGNIGPILDSALEYFHLQYTILCPALPVNGRTVQDGRLFIDGIPLDESHMRNHPLTPMWSADIATLMQEQSKYPCFKLTVSMMEKGRPYIQKFLHSLASKHTHFYLIPDYYDTSHCDLIYSLFEELPILSGASGLLSTTYLDLSDHTISYTRSEKNIGKTLLLAGSCSKITRLQIDEYRKSGNPIVKIDPYKILSQCQTAESLWKEAKSRDKILFYSSDCISNVRFVQQKSHGTISKQLESIISQIASWAVQSGYTQIIVAGGETSGAVIQTLGYQAFFIGRNIAPGVPEMIPVSNQNIRLVLKSGNFGQPDFFERAVFATSNIEGGSVYGLRSPI